MTLKPRRFNRDEYYRMAESGVLSPHERVELIDGVIVSMPPQNLPHAHAISASTMRLVAAFQATHIVRCQSPITLADDCEPEPDFALITKEHLSECNAQGKHPTRPDLVMEISDSSLSFNPSDAFGFGYRSIRLLSEAELASPLFAPDHQICVADLLGPAIPTA